MKKIALAAMIMVVPCFAHAKEKPDYLNGTLLQVDPKGCSGSPDKAGTLAVAEFFRTDGEHRKTHPDSCQEYTLESAHVVYRIRAKYEKHPALLPIGETATFRIHKDKLVMRMTEWDGKEREYIVVSKTPRQDSQFVQMASINSNR